jgi:hypothetical protein
VRRLVSVLALFVLCLTAPAPLAAEGKDDVRRAGEAFGQALLSRQAPALRKLLPEKGKVELSLARFGPEDGSFAPPQVEALFRDFLGAGSVRGFEIEHVEGDCRAHGVVRARVALVDRLGSPGRVGLHLVFQLEAGRWVLRGIRETSG